MVALVWQWVLGRRRFDRLQQRGSFIPCAGELLRRHVHQRGQAAAGVEDGLGLGLRVQFAAELVGEGDEFLGVAEGDGEGGQVLVQAGLGCGDRAVHRFLLMDGKRLGLWASV